MRVAIFGGAFDPPTTAHILQISELLNLRARGIEPSFDQVWVIPCADKRADKQTVEAGSVRRELLELAIKSTLPEIVQANVQILTDEVESGEFIPTAVHYRKMLERYPGVEALFVIGSDSLEHLSEWSEGQWVLSNVPFFIVKRPGFSSKQDLPLISHFADSHFITIRASSTEARQRIQAAKSSQQVEMLLCGVVPPQVIRAIIERRLYGL